MEQHAATTVRLPLRLAAEPYAKRLSDTSVALGLHCHRSKSATHNAGAEYSNSSAEDVELAMLVDDDGIRAFCSSQLIVRSKLLSLILGDGSITRNENGGIEQECESIRAWKKYPLWLLVRTSTGSNAMQWYCYKQGEETAAPATVLPDATTTLAVHDVVCAHLITNSIRMYYAQQILEPSVRGFLSVLEKQFARADLYLFELLQNAVDDGASVVRFAVDDLFGSLRVSHDGRKFTPLDVLGLSSVGLSTKSRRGKRTIGFMGVGFKAVYKRYAKVCIQDGTYSFVYQEPTAHSSSDGYGWVMLPLWNKQALPRQIQMEKESMCHFSLERPRGGMHSVLRDLSVLPVTAPPLLGRAALVKMDTGESINTNKKWTLDWNGKVHVVERTRIEQFTAFDASEIVTVNITERQQDKRCEGPQSRWGRQSRWLFISHKFLPSQSALESYLQHTKRPHSGMEEVCGFINLASQQTKPGRVHSVLPTKISLPMPMHVNGSWLLSVDRQQVQDLSDNAWNLDILKALPSVVTNFFRWASAERLEDYKALLPLLPMPSPSNPDMSEILGQCISIRGLQRAFFAERILPVATSNSTDTTDPTDINESSGTSMISTEYYEGQRSIWVPPSFLVWLGNTPDILRIWLGKLPLRTDIMGDAAYHPIFANKSVIGQLDSLPDQRARLCSELLGRNRKQTHIQTILRMMAAIGAGYDEHPDHKTSKQPVNQKSSNRKQLRNATRNDLQADSCPACPPIPSSMKSWTVFLTENETLASVDQIVLPAEDFASVPKALVTLLRPYFLKKEERQQHTQSRQENYGRNNKRAKKNGRNSKWPILTSKPPIRRLHPLLEDEIIRIYKSGAAGFNPSSEHEDERVDGDWDRLSVATFSFLRRASSEMPSNVIDVSSAATNLLVFYHRNGDLTNDNLSAVLQIAEFALQTGNPSLLPFVLVDDSERSSISTRLIPAAEAYIGKLLDENGSGSDLENFAGKALPYISKAYSSIVQGSTTKQNKLLRLFSLAGVRAGLSVSVSAIVDIEKDRTTLKQDVIPKLPGEKLPQLRKNPTKSDISLPYGIGEVMNRRHYSLLDAQLSREWESLIISMSPESAVGFISLLLAMPVEDNVDVCAKNVSAAAKCLLGQAETATLKENPVEAGSGNILTARIGNDVAVPLRSRLYFLPPGQPGARALDISESCMIKQLRKLKWLPCATTSAAMPLTLLRPEEALLEADASRPEMPLVQLPGELLRRLKSSPVGRALTWGTHAPPPPVTELVELTKEANSLQVLSFIDTRREKIALVASKLISVWASIARAYLRGELTGSHLKTIKSLGGSCSNCFIPVRRVVETRGNDNWVVSIDRCVRMPEKLDRAANNRDNLKQLTMNSLVSSHFMCDFNHSIHNPFFSQPEISGAIITLVGIKTAQDFRTDALIRASGAFIRYCCEVEPIISSRLSPLRASFSYAMRWCIESPKLTNIGSGLKVWVRHGPGIGSKALRRRWVSPKNGPVQVVLDDSRVRSALLTPEMGIQLLGVLNHTEHEKDCPDAITLSQIDKEVVKYCGIMRLSDTRFTVKTKARGAGAIIEGASSKIQLVCALLKSMESNEDVGVSSNSQNEFLSPSWEPPLIIRHDSLDREFRAPGMNTPSLTPMYAVFGRAPKTKKKCILVCGGPEDYSVELEELIVGFVKSSSPSHTKPHRAAIRLLSHLENDSSFSKFLKRDFADFEVTQKWQQLVGRQRTIQSLKEAENAKNATALRELLITAEEMCENDPDGGDAILKSSRDLLSVLETEAETRRLTKRNNVMKQLREAQFAKDARQLRHLLIHAEELCEDDPDGGDAALQSARELLPLLESEAESKLVEDARKLGKDTPNCGRGRGVSRTLPSWMTSGKGPTALIDANGAGVLKIIGKGAADSSNRLTTRCDVGTRNSGPDSTDNPHKYDKTSTSTAPVNSLSTDGEGLVTARGVSNLPAWMTRGVSCPPGDDPWGQQPSSLSNDGSDKSSGLSVGRGRGVSNLPAWMTNKDKLLGGSNNVIGRIDINLPSSMANSSPDQPLSNGVTNLMPPKAKPLPDQPMSNGVTNLPSSMSNHLPDQPMSNGNSDRSNSLKNEIRSNEEISKLIASTTEDTRTNAFVRPSDDILSDAKDVSKIGVGRGRGVSNLPAWMTKNDKGNALVGSTRVSSPSEAAGRGRCITNLPSWMANSSSGADALKRGHSQSSLLDNIDEERPTKKARGGLTISEYILRLSIDPSCESDFVDRLKLKIEEEAKLQGGLATLLPFTNK